jgi:dTDP-4-amino-4,6-dideoxygalactose transaminase
MQSIGSAMEATSTTLDVPLLDLGATNGPLIPRLVRRFQELMERGDFANGAAVGGFEQRFAEYCGSAHCIGMASGLDALRLGLAASRLEPGAGVVVPAATFAATVEAVVQLGARPVVVDVSESDYNLDVDLARSASGGHVTHLLPVHLYGQLADMREIARLAQEHGLQVIEDACQAHGAVRDGTRHGERALAAAFSFYPAKNLGAMGDAGALVTDDEQIARHARALREHGETRKYHHEHVGYTARLDTIQAIVLLEKLPYLDEWNRQRRAAAAFYNRELASPDGLRLPPVPHGSEPTWHLYVVRTSQPGALAGFLRERGIQTGRHYPQPPHLAPAFRHLGYAPGDFPVAEALSREALSLPLFPGITQAQLEWVCTSVRDYFAQAKA